MKPRYLPLLLIVLIGSLFRLNQLFTQVPFFGDQAWYFLSARDALLSGNLPLTGITASITWLHQGALFTYLIIPGFALSGFNPYSGIIFSILLSLVNIILIFYLGAKIFSRTAGLIAAFIMAASPLVVVLDRAAYHTSPIPLFMTLILLILHKKQAFLSGLFLSFLYSLHLLTFILWLPAFIYVFRRNLSLFRFSSGFLLGLTPFLISGPITTGGIFVWLIYKSIAGFPDSNSPSFYLDLFGKFLGPDLFTLFSSAILGPGSVAYFILLIIPLSLSLGWLTSRFPKRIIVAICLVLAVSNWIYLSRTRYLLNTPMYNHSLADRMEISKQISAVADTVFPNITVVGPGSQFETSVAPYKYLVWWLGRNSSPTGKNYKFVVDESNLRMSVIE